MICSHHNPRLPILDCLHCSKEGVKLLLQTDLWVSEQTMKYMMNPPSSIFKESKF